MDRAAPQSGDRDRQDDYAELRAAPRITMLIRPAKLTTLEGEFVCVIRDVSSTGVSLRLFHPPPIGQRATLETEAGQAMEMERVWARGKDAGFRFAEPIDVAELVSGQSRFPKRKLRLTIELPVILSLVGQEHHAIVRNLSQQGARIECEQRIAIDQIVRLRAEHLPEVRAKVRWRRGSEYGLVFEDTFLLAEFAELAALLQSPSLMLR
ncbi:PilZ domain-containing protein [Leptolyngbya sp. 15MV]|nr:PilZ domain-containing protein [Leptolyngbya sp. 15MV]